MPRARAMSKTLQERWPSLVLGILKQAYVRSFAHEQFEYLKHVTARLKVLPEEFWSQRMKLKAKAKAKGRGENENEKTY